MKKPKPKTPKAPPADPDDAAPSKVKPDPPERRRRIEVALDGLEMAELRDQFPAGTLLEIAARATGADGSEEVAVLDVRVVGVRTLAPGDL